MKTTEFDCKINGLHVTEVSIKNFNAPAMDAIYATVERRQIPGPQQMLTATHGRCTAKMSDNSNPWVWSKETMRLLAELLQSMEQDLVPRHFRVPAGMEQENARSELGGLEEVDQV